jgi:hypothetical protein
MGVIGIVVKTTGNRMRRVVALMIAACAGCVTKAAKPAAGPPDASSGASFARDIAPVLERSCAREKRCHGAEPADDVDMDLRQGMAYRELVGKTAEQRRGALRVKAFEPDASFLVDKLTGRLYGHDGKRMPLDPVTGASLDPSPLPPGFVDDVLVPWIAAGAENN